MAPQKLRAHSVLTALPDDGAHHLLQLVFLQHDAGVGGRAVHQNRRCKARRKLCHAGKVPRLLLLLLLLPLRHRCACAHHRIFGPAPAPSAGPNMRRSVLVKPNFMRPAAVPREVPHETAMPEARMALLRAYGCVTIMRHQQVPIQPMVHASSKISATWTAGTLFGCRTEALPRCTSAHNTGGQLCKLVGPLAARIAGAIRHGVGRTLTLHSVRVTAPRTPKGLLAPPHSRLMAGHCCHGHHNCARLSAAAMGEGRQGE